MIPCKGLDQIILLLSAITSAIVPCCTHKQNSCTTEHSVIRDGNKLYSIVWKSKSDLDYSVVLSTPPCFDENGNLVVRICSNGTWLSLKGSNCHRIEQKSLCPPSFDEEDKTCVYMTEPQTWKRRCPYPGASSTFRGNYDMAWLPIKRNIQYGPFEYMLPGENYGLDYSDQHSSESVEDAVDINVDCAMKRYNNVEFTACNSTYPHVCIYAYDDFLYHCPDGCVPRGLGTRSCFCKTRYNNSNKPIFSNNLCETVAVPRYSYERSILFKLVGSDVCLVENVQENSNLNSLHIDKSLHLAIRRNEWGLYKFNDINCVICNVGVVVYYTVDLQLKFNAKSHKLYLNVYSPQGLIKFDKEEAIYCFTDAADKLKTRVDVEQVLDSHVGRRLKVYKVSIVENEPGDYWCEAFQLPRVSLITSNTVVAYKKLKGHEYSLRLQIYNFCRFSMFECKFPSVKFINSVIKLLFRDGFFSRFIKRVRLFHIYNINKQTETLDILLHLTTETKLPLLAEYSVIRRNLKRLRNTSVLFFRSSLVCLPEVTLSGNFTLHWKQSAIGKIAIPKEICVQENRVPVRRQCQGDFSFGSQWANVNGSCSQNVRLSSKTEILHSFLSSSLPTVLPNNISMITENCTDLTVLDVYYLSEALAKVSTLTQNNSEGFVSEISQIMDNLMTANSTILKQSQVLLNSTDKILDNFEDKLLSVNVSSDMFLVKMKNLIVQVSKPFLNNISGIALYGDDATSFSDFKIIHLYTNTTLNSLATDDHLEVATYVKENLLNIISENLSVEAQYNITVITTIYCKDNFFNSDMNENDTVSSRIVSISIPGYDEFLQSPIPVLFKSRNSYRMRRKQQCAFWNYGVSSETRSGYWSTLGGNYMGQLYNTSLQICYFSHLTNFAFLVRDEDMLKEGNESTSCEPSLGRYHNKVLTIISDIGCTLSVCGIAGIFVTSIVFQSWRDKVGTRILIQLCIAILLQIIFLNIAAIRVSTKPLSASFCKIVGIILHYVTIAEFSWMLVAAVLQFFRFVKVIGPMPNRIFLKAILVGWGAPIIPVMLVCLASSESYSSGTQGICYPKGDSMYIGVLLPIALIVSANLAVFIAVIRNVFVLRIESRGNSQAILKRQICLAILLFFLLGLPWIFGLISGILHHDSFFSYTFLYLFCLTATLQGFVLFVFYVILDKSTRTLWFVLFKNLVDNKRCRS